MKTLKKTLCLVLAVVMVVGVLVLPANAATTTAADADATAAFKTLNEYGVMNGVDANNTPALSKNINRQDMAAIIYRIMTGDTADKYVDNYASAANEFADSATFATWAKGYIGYVRNQGIFVGDNNGNFKPTEEIAGSDVLTVLLRCIGYGKNGEFTGANYAQNALTQATQIHMFGGVTGYKSVAEKTMDKAISRGVVAKLTYNAIQAPMVTYFNDTYSAYSSQGRPVAPNTTGATLNPSLIKPVPGTTTTIKYDEWGVPTVTTPNTLYFNNPIPAVTVDKSTTSSKALVEYKNAVTQCDLADDIGIDETTKFIVYTNGQENKTTTSINPLNTTALVGGQGRYTAVYANPDTTTKTDSPYIIVYKDTLLAKVTKVTPHKEDANGHISVQAALTLEVYDADGASSTVVLQSDTDYTTWTKGQYVILNYHQNDNATTKVVSAKVRTQAPGDDWNKDGVKDKNDIIRNMVVAPSFVGAQTKISYNSNTHTVEDVVYNDNCRYHLDGADDTMKTKFTWYQDSYGNVIGSTAISAATSFGVINKIYWSGTNGDGAVYAEVTYADGTTDKLVVNVLTAFRGNPNTGRSGANVSIGKATNSYGNNAMTINEGSFYVNADAKVNAANNGDGIINGHLFKITAATDGTYNFVEVAGAYNNAEASAKIDSLYIDGYTADFTGLGNDDTDIVSGKPKNGVVLVDAETVFLIRSGDGTTDSPYTFETKVGYGNIGDYISGEVDYANTDEDAAADVVYITAGAKGEQGWHLFFNKAVATGSGKANLVNVDFDGTAYTVYGILDGVDGSVKIKKDYKGWATGNPDDLSANTGTNIEDILSNTTTGNQLWIVYIKDGYVIDINGAAANDGRIFSVNNTNAFTAAAGTPLNENTVAMMNASGVPYGTELEEMGDYEKLSIIRKTVATDTEVNAGNITIDSVTYAVGSNTPAFGDWDSLNTAGTEKKSYTVIMVYDEDNVVVQSYIIDQDAGTEYNPGTVDPEYSATVSVNGIIAVSCETDDEIDVSSGTLKFTAKVAHGTEFNVVVTNQDADSLECTAKVKKHLDDTTTAQDIYTVTITGITESIDVKLSPKTPVTGAAAPGDYTSAAGSNAGETAKAPIADLDTWYSSHGINITSSGSKITVTITEATLEAEATAWKLKAGCFDKSAIADAKMAKDDYGYVGVTFKPDTGKTFADFKVDEAEYGTHTEAFDIYLPIAKWVGDTTTGHMEVITGLNGTTSTVTYTLVDGDDATAYTWTIEFVVA